MDVEKPTKAEAQKLLDWVASLDPAWSDRIGAMREERGTDPLQIIAILCCFTLESGAHMSIPIMEQLLDGFAPAGNEHICPECQLPYTLVYPGQPFCGNKCADAVRARDAEARLAPERRKPGRPRVNPLPPLRVEYPARE